MQLELSKERVEHYMLTELPPLPESCARVIAYTGQYATGGYCAEVHVDSARNVYGWLYTADQMRAYGEACTAAERERWAKLWTRQAYATLGVSRDSMSAADVGAVQRFLGA